MCDFTLNILSSTPLIGRTQGGSNVYPMTDLTPDEIAESRACTSSLTLVHNTTYYSTLTVFNGAMNMQSITVTSDGGKQDCSVLCINHVNQ